MASLRQWETLQLRIKELRSFVDLNNCPTRLCQTLASICLQVAADRDYQPSLSDWSRIIQTLQARDLPIDSQATSVFRSSSLSQHKSYKLVCRHRGRTP